jgi:choline-glycine betaine transporter
MRSAEDSSPAIRSHYLPRTRQGWIGVVLFILLFALAEPPVVNTVANRVEPWILGVPFLYAYLLVVYFALIGVLIWVMRRGV